MLTFLGIGTQKSGTTWLYSMLKHHPRVRFPNRKEVHFWNSPAPPPLDWYRNLFDGDGCWGDMTPAYQVLPVEKIREVRAAFPDVRIIFSMRNPIDRAWSAAKMALGRAQLDFHEASDQWFIDHFRSLASRRRGDYATTIRNWRSVFPSDQIAIYRFEQMTDEPVALLVQIARHLGLDPDVFEALPPAVTGERVFASTTEPLREPFRAVLNEVYRDQVVALEDYLQLDLRSWRVDGAKVT